MALLDPYLTREEYSEGANRTAAADNELLGEDLDAGSRLLDSELGVIDGAFNDGGAGNVITLDAGGGSTLYLRDRAGRAIFIRAVAADGIGIDSERDGSYDGYTLDFDDAWVRPLPEMAALAGRPYTAIELLPLSTATISCWPDGAGIVRINCTLGWATVPAAIKKAVESIVRDIRDHRGAGAVGQFQAMDQALPLTDQTWRVIASIKRQYSRRLPVVA